jgi:ABC-2 type transport system ATP-binding protein
VLGDITFDVGAGTVACLIGPNGSGKTTLLRLVAGLLEPDAGTVSVAGSDDRSVGYLAQQPAFRPQFTVRETIEFYGSLVDSDVDTDRVLKRIGLGAVADRRVDALSGGMMRLLGIAQTTVGTPSALVLDEPSSGLDPTGMQEMREIIRKEAESGRTVFFSSHILGEVEAVCDRVGIMNEGELVAEGTLDELRENLDLGASIQVEVLDPPSAETITGLDGVESVSIEDNVVEATLSGPAAKIRVVNTLDERTRVNDIISEDTSLEQLFNTYTGNGEAEAAESTETAEPAPQEVAQ